MTRLADLSLDALAALLAERGLSLDFGAARARIRSDVAGLVPAIQRVYGEFAHDTDSDFHDVAVRLVTRGGARWFTSPRIELESDTDVPFDPFPPETHLPLLEWGINFLLAHRLNHRLLLHAGVVEMGGRAIVAHPDSAKVDQRWRAWETPFDGLEWINADSEWRDDSGRRLITSALHSIVRPAEAVTSLFDRPGRTLDRWDRTATSRALVGLAAVDAHASIGLRESDEPRGRSLLTWPSYRAMFRTLQQAVVLEAPLTGDARVDERRVFQAVVRQ